MSQTDQKSQTPRSVPIPSTLQTLSEAERARAKPITRETIESALAQGKRDRDAAAQTVQTSAPALRTRFR